MGFAPFGEAQEIVGLLLALVVAGQLGVKSKVRKGPMTTAKERALQKRMQNLRRQQKKARAAKRMEEVKKLQVQIKAVLEELEAGSSGKDGPSLPGPGRRRPSDSIRPPGRLSAGRTDRIGRVGR